MFLSSSQGFVMDTRTGSKFTTPVCGHGLSWALGSVMLVVVDTGSRQF